MVLGFHTPKVAASGTLLGGDPIRIEWRSNLANRLANEEAQLDWHLQFLALGIFHCSGNPLVGPSRYPRTPIAHDTASEILNDRCAT